LAVTVTGNAWEPKNIVRQDSLSALLLALNSAAGATKSERMQSRTMGAQMTALERRDLLARSAMATLLGLSAVPSAQAKEGFDEFPLDYNPELTKTYGAKYEKDPYRRVKKLQPDPELAEYRAKQAANLAKAAEEVAKEEALADAERASKTDPEATKARREAAKATIKAKQEAKTKGVGTSDASFEELRRQALQKAKAKKKAKATE
jgi:hypothetical protein